MKNNIVGICPGSFDPITNGHLDIIFRASKLFNKIIVLLLNNPDKKYTFNVDERLKMINNSIKHIENVEVQYFDGLLANYTTKSGETLCLIKGLRAISDFEYEIQHAITNKILNNNLETIFIHSGREYTYLSSSTVKQVAKFNGNIDMFVHKDNLSMIMQKICNKE